MGHIVRTISLLSCLTTAAFADVGKEELKKLVQAGLSDDLIVNYVRYKAPLSRLSADDVIELKKSGLGDSLLVKLLPYQEPAAEASPAPKPASTTAAMAKLLADPDIVYDGRAFYPRSYFSSGYSGYSSAAIGSMVVSPGWTDNTAARWNGCVRWGASWGSSFVQTGGFCSSGGRRVCYR
jgi:hypothetical protein